MHIINKILILGSWLVVLLLVHTSCTNSVDHSERTLKLLPEPAQLTVGKEAFILQDDMIISINAPSLKSAADYLVSILQRATGYKFVVTEEGRGHIQLCIDEKLPHKEGNYTLIVDGFLFTSNVRVEYIENVQKNFADSDHNPVVMKFSLIA